MSKFYAVVAVVMMSCGGPDAVALVGGAESDEDVGSVEGALTSSSRATSWFPISSGNSWTFESSGGTRVVRLSHVGQGMAVLEGLLPQATWIGVTASAPNTLYAWSEATHTWRPFLRFGYATSQWSYGTAACTGLTLRRTATGAVLTTPAGTFADTRIIGVEQVSDPRALCAPPPFSELSFAAGVGLVGFKTGRGERFLLKSATVNGQPVPRGGVTGAVRLDQASYVNQPNTIVCITWPCPDNRVTATAAVTFTVTNSTATTHTWRFSSGCQYDLELVDLGGQVVRRLSDERACTAALTQLTLRPGESKAYTADLKLEDTAGLQLDGSFTARAWLIGTGGPTVAASAPLSVRIGH